jgi:alcohol dehydrogenase class IV
VHTPADLPAQLDIIMNGAISARQTASPPRVPVICVPTTLSAGEYTLVAGATDDTSRKKFQFLVGPAVKLVVLDAALACTTPPRLWLASGFRALDHCVEAFVSTMCNVVTEAHAAAGLRLLVPALLHCRAASEGGTGADETTARHEAQMGALEALVAFRVPTPVGASHGIGHMLGPLGVVHGETSAVLLPAVCAYNARHGANVDRQHKLAEVLWAIPEMREVCTRSGLNGGEKQLGKMLRALTRALGLPETLKEVGVGKDKVDLLAEHSLEDVCSGTNPVPLTTKEQVLELLAPVIE